ncbi:hypothetical protein AMTR_s00003p00267060 [Amborella trichopoda]|uniref:HAT C-terminal dimerisation domain-containing protein n=1 Tax=Amborella trichopoda TaxID=13333 RepID=W1P0U6_AMBTC|nr:hypothetical protein AMTR_s00003p00267060 [Amborella trichopoda]
MVDAISAISPGYEVPTYQDMRGRILKKVLEEVKSHIQTYRNPGFSDDHPGVTTGILDCIERLVSGQRNHDKVIKELNVYKSSGADWWSTFGGQCPNLKRLAMRVLSQTCSASGYEENAKMKLIDPIALENIDTSEEWVVEFEPSMLEGDDDMDWMTLDRPIVGEDIPLELMSMEVGDGNTQVEQLGEEEDGTDIQ